MLLFSKFIHALPEILQFLPPVPPASSNDPFALAKAAELNHASTDAGDASWPAASKTSARLKSLYRRSLRDQRRNDSFTYSKELHYLAS
jgi:hypothetical protein